MPVASSTALVTSLWGSFYEVLAGPGIVILGSLLGVSIIFFAYNRLSRRLK